jgi:hypothetical protein
LEVWSKEFNLFAVNYIPGNMAQATSADYDQFQEDPSQNEGKGLFSKLKDKTKEQGRKLRSKMGGSDHSDTTGDTGATNFDAGEDEGEDAPVHNAVSQPAYDKQPRGGDVGSHDETPADTTGPTPDDTTSVPPNEDEEGLTKSFQGLSTNEQSGPEGIGGTPGPESTNETDSSKPITEQTSDGVGASVTPGSGNSEQQDKADAPPVTEQVGQQTQQFGDKASESGKTWSQWAAQKVGYAKDTTAANIPTTAEGKPIHQHAYDTVTANMPTTAEGKPYHQHAYDTAVGAKDSLYSATQPGEHDKALSQKVTETMENLPATIKSSLGFGGKAGSSPTTTPASSDTPASSPSEEAPGALPQSPSLVGRITGLFGSKKPATGDSAPSSETAASETGAEPTTTS